MTKLEGRVVKLNVKYVWHSSGGCKKCDELEGREFYSQDEIPERPHPNCKCTIEVVPVDEEPRVLTLDSETDENERPESENGSEEKQDEELRKKREEFVKMLAKAAAKSKKGVPTGAAAGANTAYPNAGRNKKTISDVSKLFNKQLPIAHEFWKMASEHFKESSEFINKNGYIYPRTESLVKRHNIQRFEGRIKAKVQSQYHRNDTCGVYFHENSVVAKAISNSEEYKQYLQKNKEYIKNGGKITKDSIQFHLFKSSDLFASFGKIEILESKISNDGKYIETYLVDTYDFNPGENPIIEAAREVQEAGMLTPYYTVTKVVTPI